MRSSRVWAHQVGPPMVDASLCGLSLLLDTGPRRGGVFLGQKRLVLGRSLLLPPVPKLATGCRRPREGGRETGAKVLDHRIHFPTPVQPANAWILCLGAWST